MIDLKAPPFFLDANDIQWVYDTLEQMSVPRKIRQLFCPLGISGRKKDLLYLVNDIGIGGIMYRPDKAVKAQKIHRRLQENSEIPLLIAGNLESGGIGAALDGTYFGTAMQAAATGDVNIAEALGRVSCGEGAAIGINWSFGPVADIDLNFRNPITNLRTFGNKAELITDMAKAYMRAAADCGIATAVKHFPGDGADERDQHLLTSVNSLSCAEWDSSYGKIYSALIEAGTKSVMVGHIAQPAWQERLSGKRGQENYMPASLSKELMTGLLRNKLGFNGLIVTDATPMAGFRVAMKRKDALPLSIEAGADMILFVRNLASDYSHILNGYNYGSLSKERLEQAVIRILALKASLGLHHKSKKELVPPPHALNILYSKEHLTLSAQCAERSVTLVKDTQALLPLSIKKQKRIYLNILEESDNLNTPLKKKWLAALKAEGFQVTLRDRGALSGLSVLTEKTSLLKKAKAILRAKKSISEFMGTPADFTDHFDLVIYVANYETASENTVIRIGWKSFKGMGNDIPWFVAEIPTLFISLANPYHLLDVPMIKTYINAYCANDRTIAAVIDKLMGRSNFTGVSPVDASCGRSDTMF